MLKYLFILLFIATASIYMISGERECTKTSCHFHFRDTCPGGTKLQTWNYCFGFLGRSDTCCRNKIEEIDEGTMAWSRFSSFSTFPSQYQPEGPTTNKPTYNRQNLLSPRVASISWGHVHVEGMNEHFKDIKLYPGGAKSWDWRETNTRHQPGIQPADLRELFEKDCEIIILSRGIQNMLYTKDETRDELERRGMTHGRDYFILQSEEAVQLYNQYVDQRKRVCAVIHSTC